MTNVVEVQIPFQGFYNSDHDHALEDALNMIFWDDHGDVNEPLADRARDNINWEKAHKLYAQSYAQCFIDSFLPDSGATFESLDSPKFYNFATDRIFINVPVAVAQAWIDNVDIEVMDAISADMFTSYDGFSSHYSPNWCEWDDGDLDADNLDHNQLYAFLLAHVNDPDHLEYWEREVAYEGNCNGDLDEILFEAGNAEFERVADAQYYLRQREERKWRQAA